MALRLFTERDREVLGSGPVAEPDVDRPLVFGQVDRADRVREPGAVAGGIQIRHFADPREVLGLQEALAFGREPGCGHQAPDREPKNSDRLLHV